MKNQLRLLTLAILFQAASSWAMPMLSADGSSLTSIDVGGTLYDVMFGDGVVGDVFAGVTFDAAREAEANAVSVAITDALNVLGAVNTDIAGCEEDPGGRQCLIFNPDSTPVPGGFLDRRAAATFLGRPWVQVFPINQADSSDTSSVRFLTLAVYERQEVSAVPAPVTLLLFGLGLAGLGFSRRKS